MTRGGTREVEAHIVAVAGIEHIIVLDTCAVAGDAADAVFGGSAGIGHGDTSACSDAVSLLAAVGSLEHLRIIAVGISGSRSGVVFRAAEGAAVAAFRSGYVDRRRGEEAVGEVDIVSVHVYNKLSPADEAAPVGGISTHELAREGAAIKVNLGVVAVDYADEAAVGTVTIEVAVDADAAEAVLDVVVAARGFDRKAGVVLCRAVDVAGYSDQR